MPPNMIPRISSSDHHLFHYVLRWTDLFVGVALSYGALLLTSASDILLGPFVFPSLHQKRESDLNARSKQRIAAISLTTAGVMGLLVAAMVRRCCRRQPRQSVVNVNWHDLFKYTHMARTMMAAMTAVLTWRGLRSMDEFRRSDLGTRLPTLILASAFFSMVAAASFSYIHLRLKAIHAEYVRIKQPPAVKKWK